MSSEMHSTNKPIAIEAGALEAAIASATRALLGYRKPDGHWVFELEADSTIPAEYVLLRHYLGEPVDAVLEAGIANYLRRVQGAHGGWPLVHDGDFDISASVKAYFALKMIGDSVDAPHMARAREAIRSRGGAIHSNVFTRCLLAMFGVLKWRSTPVLPIEIMLLPMWSPFHINKISYWARTTIVPLMVLASLKPQAKSASGVGIDELFLQEPHSIGMTAKAPHQSWGWFLLFRGLDAILRVIEPLFPRKLRARAIDSAVAFIEERLNGEDGLGAIYPPMANTAVVVMAMDRTRRATRSHEYDAAIARGREWIEGMQSRDGGWAAFDVNNLEYYLNNIPFSDHGALLDPPTEDVTARCVSMLAQLGETAGTSKAVADGIDYLRRTQLAEGSWYGRWGLNYVYGTWSVLSALNVAGVDRLGLSWLREVLPALGVGAVPKFEKHQQQGGRGRDVTWGAGAAAIADNSGDLNSGDLNQIDPRPVLIVTGLVQEARIAAGPGMIVICSSSDPQQLRALLATLDSSTFRGVISFGVAGGLDPSLKSGDIVVATEVLAGDTRFLAGLALNEEMIASAALRRRRVVRGVLAGVGQVIAATACKTALRSETGAASLALEV